jgi:uncharacterized protein (DUF2141 family)
MKNLIKALYLIATILSTSLISAAELTVQIDDVKSSEGFLSVAIYNSTDTFLKKPLTGVRTQATKDGKSVVIKDLPAGEYAFVVFHDVNQNGKMDKNMLGIPTEDYAFSNNAMGNMGPPSFDTAKFKVSDAGTTAKISLR